MVALRSPARRRIGRALVAMAIALCSVALAAQAHLNAFRAGLDALDQSRWAEAARQFQTAARAMPDTGDRVTVRAMIVESYLPQFFLGQALYRMGDFQGAIAAFNASEQIGAVKRNGTRYRELQDLRREALKRAPPPTTTSAVTTTVPVSTSIVSTMASTSTIPGAIRPSEDLPRLVRDAEGDIEQARRERQAIDALIDLNALRQINQTLARTDQAAREDLEGASARLQSGSRGNAAELAEAAALARSAVAKFQEVRRLERETVGRITDELVAGTQPYFAGQYAAAKAALDRLNYPPSRFAAQVRLFRAATLHALYLVDEGRSLALRRDAATNVQECRRMAAAFRPDPRAFSPKFIQFFSAVE